MMQSLAGQYLAFTIGAEEYGIALSVVREIRQYEAPTRIPGAPDSVRGVINLRGAVIPVLDVRKTFGIFADVTPSTITILVGAAGKTVGLVVDTVSDVVDVGDDHLRELPGLESIASRMCLLAIASVGDRMLQLMDAERFLATQDIHSKAAELAAETA